MSTHVGAHAPARAPHHLEAPDSAFKVSSEPAPAPQPKPAPKPAAKPAPKPEPKPQPVPQQAKPTTQPIPQPKPQPKYAMSPPQRTDDDENDENRSRCLVCCLCGSDFTRDVIGSHMEDCRKRRVRKIRLLPSPYCDKEVPRPKTLMARNLLPSVPHQVGERDGVGL